MENTDLLECIQQRATKMVRGMPHVMEGERVKELGWFNPNKIILREILLLSPATYWEVI